MARRSVRIVGGGLAGSEAAWQVAKRGFRAHLYEMRPKVMTKAHRTGALAELVCSNSFRGADVTNAVGLLKQELHLLKTLFMECAQLARVPAGGALAVDREIFSRTIDHRLRAHPLVTVETAEVEEIPAPEPASPVIIATGPLTSPHLARAIEQLTGEGNLAFYDAISPIILGDSIDFEPLFRQSRYEKGGGDDYLNIPLTEEAYREFVSDIHEGEKFGAHEEVESDGIGNLRPFEGCMPIEDMAARGFETLRFGPLKPVGLVDPKTGRRPAAVIQLRQDDREATLWSMVGFQTRLKHGEQLRIFRKLPGLANAEFVRLGSVHRNSFINSPSCLSPTLAFRTRPGLFFAGQITGVEGYVESASGGYAAGVNAARLLQGRELLSFPRDTAIGALLHYISDPERKHFQPMNISFGLMPSYMEESATRRSKQERRLHTAERALGSLRAFVREMGEAAVEEVGAAHLLPNFSTPVTSP